MLIIFVGGSALSTLPLNGTQWAISIIIGAISLPIAVLIRLIPDDFIRGLIPRFRDHNETTPIEVPSDEHYGWNEALENIREQLTLTKTMRGGRLNALMFKSQGSQDLLRDSTQELIPGTPNGQANGDAGPPRHTWPRSRSNSALGPAAAMAGVIAGSIAGWSPLERSTGDDDSIRFSSSRQRTSMDT